MHKITCHEYNLEEENTSENDGGAAENNQEEDEDEEGNDETADGSRPAKRARKKTRRAPQLQTHVANCSSTSDHAALH